MSDVDWTAHESALWETCRVATAFLNGGAQPPPVPVSFRLNYGQDEFIVASGTFTRDVRAKDESSHRGPKAYRRARELEGRIKRWRSFDKGPIHVSNYGFYLESSKGTAPWSFGWVHILSGNMIEPRVFECVILLGSGEEYEYRITSDWAELIYVLWAMTSARHHPQRQQLTWLPPLFVQKVVDAGMWESSPLPPLMQQD